MTFLQAHLFTSWGPRLNPQALSQQSWAPLATSLVRAPTLQPAGESGPLRSRFLPFPYENVTSNRQGLGCKYLLINDPCILINTDLKEWTRSFPKSSLPWGQVADGIRTPWGRAALWGRANTIETDVQASEAFTGLRRTGTAGSTPFPGALAMRRTWSIWWFPPDSQPVREGSLGENSGTLILSSPFSYFTYSHPLVYHNRLSSELSWPCKSQFKFTMELQMPR